MKVNTSDNSLKNLQSLINFGRTSPWVIFLGFFYIIIAAFVLINPSSFSVITIDSKYAQFILSFSSFSILFVTGIYLLYQDFKRGWGLSFMIYSISFLGLSLEALDFIIADMSDPLLFLVWRTPMLIFISVMWINLTALFTENRKIIHLPALLVVLTGGGWFIFGLWSLKNIVLTMTGFLYGLFIPLTFVLAYIWYKFSKETIFASSSIIAVGFLIIGLIYTQWIPWQYENPNPIYPIFFTILSFAFIIMLRGFMLLSKDNRRLRYFLE